MGPIEKLAAIHDAVALLNGFDLASPISGISGALEDLFIQAGFIRDRLEQTEGSLSDLGDQVYKQVNKALDDLKAASTTWKTGSTTSPPGLRTACPPSTARSTSLRTR